MMNMLQSLRDCICTFPIISTVLVKAVTFLGFKVLVHTPALNIFWIHCRGSLLSLVIRPSQHWSLRYVWCKSFSETAVVGVSYLCRWWFQCFFMFISTLGKWSNLTNIFQSGWFNHHLLGPSHSPYKWPKWLIKLPPFLMFSFLCGFSTVETIKRRWAVASAIPRALWWFSWHPIGPNTSS